VLHWTTPDFNKLTDYQAELMRCIARYRVIVVPAANSVGKSRCAALAIVWFLTTRANSLVIVTAPSQHILGSIIWRELKTIIKTSRIPIGGSITKSVRASPQIFEISDHQTAIGLSTTETERISGKHAKHLMVICDEASGITEEIWQGIHSLNYSTLLITGNPLVSDGPFKEAWDRSRLEQQSIPDDQKTVGFPVSAFDSPHIHLKRSPCGLADGGFILESERVYGRDSLWWKTHVEISKSAPFLASSFDQLIPTEWVDRTINTPRKSGGRRALAMDVAKGSGKGDKTVIMVGDAFGLYHVWSSNSTSIEQAAKMVRLIAQQYGVHPSQCVYDAGGAFGSEAERYLQAVGYGQARKWFGNDPSGPRHRNRRSWASWLIKIRLDPLRPKAAPYVASDPTMPLLGPESFIHPNPEPQSGFHITPGPFWISLREELIGLRYTYIDQSKMSLETKESYSARLGRSPDYADTMMMLFSVVWSDMLEAV
jgi:hypothetical protein